MKADLPKWPDAYMSGLDPAAVIRRRADVRLGAVVFTFDWTRRVYGAGHGPSYLHYFRPAVVHGETRASWLTGSERFPTKHPKRPREGHAGLFGLDDVYDAVIVERHAWAIGEAVRRVDDADTLRKIAALAGYELPA